MRSGDIGDQALLETDPTSLNDGCIVRDGDLTPERFAVRPPSASGTT